MVCGQTAQVGDLPKQALSVKNSPDYDGKMREEERHTMLARPFVAWRGIRDKKVGGFINASNTQERLQ
jgi:hypothetical protein